MTILKKLCSSVIAASCLVVALSAPSAAQVGLNIHIGPQPPPRREYMGRPPRPGCFFRRGHYVQRYNHWVWVRGRWICR
jgi:hypothetical protein